VAPSQLFITKQNITACLKQRNNLEKDMMLVE